MITLLSIQNIGLYTGSEIRVAILNHFSKGVATDACSYRSQVRISCLRHSRLKLYFGLNIMMFTVVNIATVISYLRHFRGF